MPHAFHTPRFLLVLLSIAAIPAQTPTETLDYAAIAQIRDEGLTRSRVTPHREYKSFERAWNGI